MTEKEINIKSTDDIMLNALLSEVSKEKKIVILCHGINSNKNECEMFINLTSKLRENKINSLRFDFRTHGKSTGNDFEMTPTKEVEDIESVLNYGIDLGYQKIIILGASFGASIVSLLDYNRYEEVEAIINWYGAIDYLNSSVNYWSKENRKIANEKGYVEIKSERTGRRRKIGKNCMDEIYSLKPYEVLSKIELPILFVHGLEDKMVPYQISLKASKKCKNATIELIENAGHGFLETNETKDRA